MLFRWRLCRRRAADFVLQAKKLTMSPSRKRLAVFLTSVGLAYVAGSLTMLSAEGRRSADAQVALPTAVSPAAPQATVTEDVDIYLPQLDPQADLCQG